MARLVGYAIVGVDPKIMGIGPAPAISALLKKADLKLDDVSMVEVSGTKVVKLKCFVPLWKKFFFLKISRKFTKKLKIYYSLCSSEIFLFLSECLWLGQACKFTG